MSALAIVLIALSAIYALMGLFFIAGLFIPNRTVSPARPFVSVIIAARNEASQIVDCLKMVLNQDYPGDLFEVIVVDDRSTDNTASIVETIAAGDQRLKLVRVTEKPEHASGKKYALQCGIKESRGDILLFTDADCRVQTRWVSAMVQSMGDRVGFVIGFSEVRASTFFERLQRFDFSVLMAAACGSANWGRAMAASGQNLAYRRTAYDAVGGFESVMNRISGDDILMMQLIRQRTAWKIVFAGSPNAGVTTRAEPSWRAFLQQRTRWASNADIMIRLNPVLFVVLACVYLFHVGLVGGLFLSWVEPLIAVVTAFAIGNKLVIDVLAGILGARYFGLSFSPVLFLIWFVVQTPYTLFVGLKGLFRQFSWR